VRFDFTGTAAEFFLYEFFVIEFLFFLNAQAAGVGVLSPAGLFISTALRAGLGVTGNIRSAIGTGLGRHV